MFLMNRFFDGAFLTFGIDVLKFLESDQEDRVDPMIYVFPRMTKCTFYKYGVSGEVERHDAVCILPLNVVNEKIYVFLWFWFLFLGVLSFFTVLYRVSNPGRSILYIFTNDDTCERYDFSCRTRYLLFKRTANFSIFIETPFICK